MAVTSLQIFGKSPALCHTPDEQIGFGRRDGIPADYARTFGTPDGGLRDGT